MKWTPCVNKVLIIIIRKIKSNNKQIIFIALGHMHDLCLRVLEVTIVLEGP